MLNLTGNFVKNKGGSALAAALREMPRLEQLGLGWNQISGVRRNPSYPSPTLPHPLPPCPALITLPVRPIPFTASSSTTPRLLPEIWQTRSSPHSR